jgi:hypothetical protein
MTDHALSDRDRALLVALADGKLRGRRRAAAEQRLARLPDMGQLLHRQQSVAAKLRGGPAAPATLELALPPRPRETRWPRPAIRLGLAAAGAAAVVAAALAVVLPSGGGPSTTEFADLGLLPATQPAPKPVANRPQQLNTSFEGVSYPNWGQQFGWHATGARSGTVDGRATRTVYYQHMEHRIGYTVVSGKPLDPPDDTERISSNGVQIALYRDRNAAVFTRNGHTCVLAAGHLMHRSTLVKLAAWKGEGTLSF